MYSVSRPKVVRQHETTEVSELYGATCHAFLAVCVAGQETVGPMYIYLDGIWHRFYLDAGLLFWTEGCEPHEDDELLNNESFVDWGERLKVCGIQITGIIMRDSVLTLAFANGEQVVLKHNPGDEATMIVRFGSLE